jgi:hypothetical protein
MCDLDFSKLIGRESFTLPCTISRNGLGIKTFSLMDTGAGGHTFIPKDFAKLACYHLDVTPQVMPMTCIIRGFDGREAEPVTHYLELTLLIDGHRQIKVPMLIADLGKHDMILGREWASQSNVLIDCRNHRLIWPEEKPLPKSWNKIISVNKKDLLPKQLTQNTRRMHSAETSYSLARRQNQKRILRRHTWETDLEARYKAMKQELNDKKGSAAPPSPLGRRGQHQMTDHGNPQSISVKSQQRRYA